MNLILVDLFYYNPYIHKHDEMKTKYHLLLQMKIQVYLYLSYFSLFADYNIIQSKQKNKKQTTSKNAKSPSQFFSHNQINMDITFFQISLIVNRLANFAFFSNSNLLSHKISQKKNVLFWLHAKKHGTIIILKNLLALFLSA